MFSVSFLMSGARCSFIHTVYIFAIKGRWFDDQRLSFYIYLYIYIHLHTHIHAQMCVSKSIEMYTDINIYIYIIYIDIYLYLLLLLCSFLSLLQLSVQHNTTSNKLTGDFSSVSLSLNFFVGCECCYWEMKRCSRLCYSHIVQVVKRIGAPGCMVNWIKLPQCSSIVTPIKWILTATKLVLYTAFCYQKSN